MKRIYFLILLSAFLVNCSNRKPGGSTTETSAKTRTDSTESYEGIIPCADCPGIKTTLSLNYSSKNYTLSETYLERNNGKAFITKGSFDIKPRYENNPDADLLILNDDKSGRESYFARFSKDTAFVMMLDADKKPIQSGLNYKLLKVNE